MSISAITSNSVATQSGANPWAQDLKALQQDIQQVNTSSAQTALTTLEKDLASSPAGAPAANSPVGKALQALSTALQNGNDSQAAKTVSWLQSALNGAHRHHHGGGSQSAAALSGIENSSTGTSATSTPESSNRSTLNTAA